MALSLILFSRCLSVSNTHLYAVPPDSYHPLLTISIDHIVHRSTYSLFFYDFSRADNKSINNFFNSFKWEFTFSSYDANEAMAVLFDVIYSSILSFILQVTPCLSAISAWITPDFKKLS